MEKKLNMSYQVIFLTILCAVLVPVRGFAADGETIHILKISPQDQRAVIRQADGKMQVVKVGDAVGVTGKIIEISAGRVVIEEVSNNETEKIIIRLENGKQRVERLKRTADKQPPLYSPNTQKQNGK